MSLLTICSSSLRHLGLILKPPNTWIRIGVTGGGCNGLRYDISPTREEPLSFDEPLSYDVPIYVCGKSLLHLIGSNLHWTEDSLGARIEFQNPNAGASCGCGETFSL